MEIQASFVALDINGIALAFGDDFVFAKELGGGFAEGFFLFDFATAQLALQLQMPVFGNIPGARETFLDFATRAR